DEAVARPGLQDAPDARLALALAILRRRVEIIDADRAGLLQHRVRRRVVHRYEALAHRRAAEAEAGHLDRRAAQPPQLEWIHRLLPVPGERHRSRRRGI